MKQLLTLMLLVLGTAAFANTDKNTEPKPATENNETVASKKAAVKAAKIQENAAKPATVSHKEQRSSGTTKTCTTAEKSGFGISGYFVDFVHTSNVKLVKLLLN